MIQVRYSTSPSSAETATTADLRENFLVGDLFVSGEVRGTYTHDDRMVIGGAVRGGSVYGPWPGLEREQLFEGRDLAVTTDFRDVLGELVRDHLGQKTDQVFPDYTVGRGLGLLKT